MNERPCACGCGTILSDTTHRKDAVFATPACGRRARREGTILRCPECGMSRFEIRIGRITGVVTNHGLASALADAGFLTGRKVLRCEGCGWHGTLAAAREGRHDQVGDASAPPVHPDQVAIEA